MNKLIVVMGLAMLAAACSTVKRYSSVDNTQKEKPVFLSKGDNEDNLRVRMNISDSRISDPAPSGSGKSLWDLGNEGQKELLDILSQRYKDNDKFTDILNNQYLSDDGGGGGAVDYVRKNVRIVFSISRWHPYEIMGKANGFSPADRIEYLKYKLTLDDSASTIKFTGWNRYGTAYGSINIADVNFQESLSATAGAGNVAGIVTGGSGSGAGGTSGASKTENQKVRYRYIQLNGSIGNRSLQLESEGTREVDLAGNVTADVSMEFDAFPEILYTLSKAKNDSGIFLQPGEVHLNETVALVPKETTIHNIRAMLTYDYAYRHVEKGDNTYYEWDDKVRYVTGTVSKEVTLMKAKDILPPFCCLKFQCDTSIHNKNFLKIRNLAAGLGVQETNLAFANQSAANTFITWLVSYKCPPGELNQPIKLKNGYALWYNGSFLTRQRILDNQDQLAEIFQYDSPD
ncbi:MAG TPA: hypothetical protein VNU70_09150 [Puia sp.]|jgi:hypothetical protein|nr:hypothetical protein [Puia sp.]